MHEIRTIATNDCSVCQSVGLSVTRLHCAETVERSEVLCGVKISMILGTLYYTGVLTPHGDGRRMGKISSVAEHRNC